jgi:predicted nucleic acid-binding protein
MLDTNACIFLMKNRPEVVSRFRQNMAYGVAISAITASELYFGVITVHAGTERGKSREFERVEALKLEDWLDRR